MHIGIVSFTDVDSGLDLANALAELGFKITFYTSQSHAHLSVGDSQQPISKMYERGLLNSNVAVRLIQLSRMRDLHSFSVMKSVAKMIKDDGVDVAHILIGGGELWTAVLANMINWIPVVSTIIIPQPNVGEFPPPKIVTWINRLIAMGSDLIIVNGKDHLPIMKQVYNYPLEKVVYIPLGPRTVFLKWRSREDVAEADGTILFLGRINKHKGLEYLIKAQPLITREIPSARIVVAGQGDDLDRCKTFIEDHQKIEIYDGFIKGEKVAEFFQKASVIAVPYITAATSGILMTAYVFGKPVVATRTGSLPEYVKDGITGYLVDPGSEQQLAEALIRVLADRDLRYQMGNNAKEWVQNELSWANIADQTSTAYEKARYFYYEQNS